MDIRGAAYITAVAQPPGCQGGAKQPDSCFPPTALLHSQNAVPQPPSCHGCAHFLSGWLYELRSHPLRAAHLAPCLWWAALDFLRTALLLAASRSLRKLFSFRNQCRLGSVSASLGGFALKPRLHAAPCRRGAHAVHGRVSFMQSHPKPSLGRLSLGILLKAG